MKNSDVNLENRLQAMPFLLFSLCIFGFLSDSLLWTIVGAVGGWGAFIYLILYNRKRDKLQKQQNLYSWFKGLWRERHNWSIPIAVNEGRELLPLDWLEAQPEFQKMKKKDKKLLRSLYKR